MIRYFSLARSQTPKAFFDEPAGVIDQNVAAFRGWAAAAEPIEEIILEADGRIDTIKARHGRPDVGARVHLPHIVGWQHSIRVASESAGRRSFVAKLRVNGKCACTRRFVYVEPTVPGFVGAPDLSSSSPNDSFIMAARALSASARFLEVGTKQSNLGVPTHSRLSFPGVEKDRYTMVDLEPGADVDRVADLHNMPADWTASFDVVIANAVFEHLERPWIAAREIARVLKPGGICRVSTHQTFPLHGFPSDFFRFSKEALSLIFQDADLRVVDCAYEHRTHIIVPTTIVPLSSQDEWNAIWPSYLLVNLFAQKG